MKLVRQLADGHWHSGQALADALGISRAAVWKRIERVRETGLPVQAVRGRGYRLAGGLDLLDEKAIADRLSALARRRLDSIEVLDRVDSTSDYLLRPENAVGRRACFAEYQTGGRGRRGRKWVSPYAANLYFSVGWPFAQTPAGIGALSLAVGVELAAGLQALGAKGLGLKWPNDLVAEQGKLGGILVEHRGEAAGGSRMTVGVGINLGMAPEQAAGIDQPWVGLHDLTTEATPRNAAAAAALDAVVRALERFEAEGFAPFRRRWQGLDASHGRPVTLDTGRERIRGHAVGVAPDGALLVERGGETERYYAGDLSLRID